MPRKYRWTRIIIQIPFGLFCGFVIDSTMLGIVEFLRVAISLPEPRGFMVAILVAVFIGIPLWFAIALPMAEARAQATEYRSEINLCRHCGYSLRGIRRSTDRCPECGELFKKFL
jgi:hypothetical protein